MPKKPNPNSESRSLKGWQRIAEFLGQPVSVVQRWAREGMPVEHKGRSVYGDGDVLNQWLGRELTGEPLQIANADTDLSSELKRGIAFVKKQRRSPASKRAVARNTPR